MRRLLLALIALPALVWGGSGVFVVDHGDAAVVFRFGAVQGAVGPGLHARLPWPFATHTAVSVSELRRSEPGSTRMLTGDTNLVDIDLVVQYTVGDPVAWLTAAHAPGEIAASVVIATTTDVVTTMDVDTLLTTGRVDLQRRVMNDAQGLLDEMDVGVKLVAVEVRELSPPPAVVDAFNDVSSARGDRETLALAAEAYVSARLPAARGAAATTLEAAQGAATARIARATGDISRFEAVAKAHATGPAALRAQLRSQALERVGARAKVLVLPPGSALVLDAQGRPLPP